MRSLIPVTALFFALGIACGGDDAGDEEKTEQNTGDAEDKRGDKSDGAADADGEADNGATAPRTPGGHSGKSGKNARNKNAKSAGKAGKAGKTDDKTYSDAKVVCCDRDPINKVLQEYLDVAEALANDTVSLGDISALSAQSNAAQIDEQLPPPSRSDAAKLSGEVAEILNGDLAAVRGRWDAISQSMYALVERHKGTGEHTVVYVNCGMESGGHWLQQNSAIANPYFGSGKMSGCGQFQ